MELNFLKGINSAYFEHKITENNPELIQFIGWDEYPGRPDDQGNLIHELYFKIPHGDRNVEELYVECSEYDITIGVPAWHTHFHPNRTGIDECIQLINDILNEQILFCYMYKDGKMVDSSHAKLDEYFSDFSTKVMPDKLYFWSWNGRYKGELTYEEYRSIGDHPIVLEIIKRLKHF